MTLDPTIAFVRRNAPPLWTVDRIDRRGARLRRLNTKAIEYVRRSGLPLEVVYPDVYASVRAHAPQIGAPEAGAYVRALGLPLPAVYPGATFGGEQRAAAGSGGRWGWTVAGMALGACLGGPLGLAVGGGLGWLGGDR